MKSEASINDINDLTFKEEWEKMFKKQQNKEKWETVKYSKNQISKAGRIVIRNDIKSDEFQDALKVLNNWRASHAYPLQVISSNLRQKNKMAIVVQRLKRFDSIVGKLQRFPEMNLYRMQDLGGCRVIVETIEEVYQAKNLYKKSRIRHILKREDDYISNPKQSGYRSYHMVYQFQSDKKETYNNNMLIEIQFRTKLQHIWATAVETMGMYTQSALKASYGDENILRFFSLVSSVFSIMEKTERVPDTPEYLEDIIKEIKGIDNNHKVVSRLSAIRVAINHVTGSKKGGYYILLLNYKAMTLRIRRAQNSEAATEIYNKIERSKTKDIDAVLVSANSFDTLRDAYPNYFTDIGEFVELMRRMLSDDEQESEL